MAENGPVELTDALLSKLAGWEAVKQARGLLAADRVVESNWQPPRLQGTVREGSSSYRAGLVIRSASDADNLCTCRISRERGLICAHSVAVGLHVLKGKMPATPAPVPAKIVSTPPQGVPRKAVSLRRIASGETGEPLQLFLIFPPNLPEA